MGSMAIPSVAVTDIEDDAVPSGEINAEWDCWAAGPNVPRSRKTADGFSLDIL